MDPADVVGARLRSMLQQIREQNFEQALLDSVKIVGSLTANTRQTQQLRALVHEARVLFEGGQPRQAKDRMLEAIQLWDGDEER